MLGRALKMAFWISYDHLGKLLVASLFWSLAAGIPGMVGWAALASEYREVRLVLGFPATALALVVFLPISSAGIAHMVKEFIDTRDGSVRTMFSGMREYGLRAFLIGVCYVLATTCLAVSVWFYASWLGNRMPLLGYSLSALALWCLAFVLVTSLLVMPTLVQKKAGVFSTLKLTALIVLDNPFTCIGLVIQILALTALSVLIVPLFFFLYGGVVITLSTSAYEMFARKYAAVEAAMNAQEDTACLRGVTKPRATDGVPDEEHDEYLNRGLRDFLFPWKG